jgi:polyisoprenoid-binding protein YceI
MNVWIKRALLAISVLIVCFFAAVVFYVTVLREDAPAALGRDDLAAAVAGTTDAAGTTAPATTDPATSPASTAPATTAPTTAGASSYDGAWNVTDESEFGYRVEEVLFGVNATAAGRSNEISGGLTISGTTVEDASFTVDVASITSDDARRDGQFSGQIMDTAEFPEASFVLTAPIELGSVPTDGAQVTATATGDLTLHGVTRSVTFDVTAQAGTGRIGVLGSIPVTFSDYGIDNPSRAGITTEDDGLVEFVLVLVPA